MPGSIIEVELYHGGYNSSVKFVWEPDGPPAHDHRMIEVSKDVVFDTAKSEIYFRQVSGPGTSKPDGGPAIDKIDTWLYNVGYNSNVGELLTQVTVRYPNLPNVIRMRKLVMKHAKTKIEFDDDEVTSGLFG
jgi:hypothetical protein